MQGQIKVELDCNRGLIASTTRPLMKKGMQVFAKWIQKTDVRYYPGIITNEVDDEDAKSGEGEKLFYVKFDDGFERGGLRWDEMIPVGMLEMGNAINVGDSDTEEGIYYSAKLSAYPEFVKEEKECTKRHGSKIDVMYTVDYEKTKLGCTIPQFETERISYKRVFLDKNQAFDIMKSLGGYKNPPVLSTLGAEMSLDNLVTRKRRSRLSSTKIKPPVLLSTPQKKRVQSEKSGTTPRKSRITSCIEKTPDKLSKNNSFSGIVLSSAASNSKRGPKRGGDCVESSVAEDEEGKDSHSTKRKFTRKTRSICALSTTEEETTEKSPPRIDRRKRKLSKPVSEYAMNANLTKRSSSKILNNLFEGLHFVLTQGSKLSAPDRKDYGDVDMTSAMETETESEMLDAIPKDSSPSDNLTFNRKKLKELIIKHGGVVLEEYPGGTHCPFPQPFMTDEGQTVPKMVVVSDRYCQTMSFLLAIGFGTARISHLWVLQSITEGKLQPIKNYYLPVGWSVIEEREIEQNEHTFGEKLNGGIFYKHHILISSTTSAFIADWKPLLARLGATVSSRRKGKLDKSLKAIDVVVIDENNASKTIVHSASEKDISIVTATWIIQSLINGYPVPYQNFLFQPVTVTQP